MKIEFIAPHSLNMGEDFEYLAAFKKGKSKAKTENLRLLIKGLKTGKEYILMLTVERTSLEERFRIKYLPYQLHQTTT